MLRAVPLRISSHLERQKRRTGKKTVLECCQTYVAMMLLVQILCENLDSGKREVDEMRQLGQIGRNISLKDVLELLIFTY